MKVKMLRRNPLDYVRETKDDIHKLQRNYDPALHPFEEAREYQRALNSAKLERVFAKPFIGSLSGHRDVLTSLAKHPQRLSLLASSDGAGEIRLWDLSKRECSSVLRGHKGFVRGIVFSPKGSYLLSVGDDKQILTWNISDDVKHDGQKFSHALASKGLLMDITHSRNESSFATCGESVILWDSKRQVQIQEMVWGMTCSSGDTVSAIRFNQVETSLIGACSSDRSVILYDIRQKSPMRKVITQLRNNAIAWNPMEAYVFAVANEDYNIYSFDIRSLKRPLNIHMDHVSAVIDVDYSPTGLEIVSGSYDKTIRIFNCGSGHSREIYHTRRMQRLTRVLWTGDNRYIVSASDEMNIRLWKAFASQQLGAVKDRQKSAYDYAQRLKEKYAGHPEIRKIIRKRHVPKHVKNAREEHRVIRESKKRKQSNVRRHSKPGTVPYVAERDKHVLKEEG